MDATNPWHLPRSRHILNIVSLVVLGDGIEDGVDDQTYYRDAKRVSSKGMHVDDTGNRRKSVERSKPDMVTVEGLSLRVPSEDAVESTVTLANAERGELGRYHTTASLEEHLLLVRLPSYCFMYLSYRVALAQRDRGHYTHRRQREHDRYGPKGSLGVTDSTFDQWPKPENYRSCISPGCHGDQHPCRSRDLIPATVERP
jgi:hypothetical protein